MTIIMGFDLSSKKIAVTVTSTLDPGHLYMAKHMLVKEECERCFEAMTWVRDLTGTYTMTSGQGPVRAFIEKPVLGRGGAGSTIPQAQVNGAVIAGVIEAGAAAMSINNQQWKKDVLGKGNASKDEIRKGIYELWRAAYDMADGDQDLLDSAGVNRNGDHILKMHQRIERERRKTDVSGKRLVRPKRLVRR